MGGGDVDVDHARYRRNALLEKKSTDNVRNCNVDNSTRLTKELLVE